ncbi:MAG: hypothetical protein QW507_00460 [Candidatus Nanoarchaeia archaeon]|nr:hypothetical protein [Candidatus Haiyanarchaeum thermophilum]MCW1302947.1 hypothetical protein [Candidatus Haiyanarchaeum thermophilum]MCW1303625.1 hypothetical protein [Candidatus Haiyanarchaeum thermophilum]MCW1306306.1 hypothetical protein [Candidatus Haiyanarchaeum thermophilum]MCW1307184.1 hypothetical protein [Candidatus Haiyanarchaeum thermophilum]
MPARKRRPSRKKLLEVFENEEIQDFLERIVGREGMEVVKILFEKGLVNEFKLAEMVNKEINDVRTILYKLYAHRLVTFSRKRERRRGWWIYSWEINFDRLFHLLKREKIKKLEMLRKRIAEEGSIQIFECPKCELRMGYEKALENLFTCPKCNVVLREKSLEKIEKELEEGLKRIEELERIFK